MSKRRQDKFTGDLLSWEPPEVAINYEAEVAGRGRLDNKIARLIARALRDAKEVSGLSRTDVTQRMTAYLGRRISDEMLNKWSSEAAEHRIPLEAFIALIDATETKELLGFIPEIFGFAVVPKKYESIIEMHLLEEHEKDIQDRKNQLSLKLRNMR